MALQLKCDRCGRELNEPGALIFSPPIEGSWTVEKYHLCVACWKIVLALVKEGEAPPKTK